MEIVEKVKLEFREREVEIEAKIDTGADKTMFDEETLIKLGSPHMMNVAIDFGGEKKEVKPIYFLEFLKIQNHKIPAINVIGGKKNLIGHDILQRTKAVIDEGDGTVKFPDRDGVIEI